jgi:hypothetical protein
VMTRSQPGVEVALAIGDFLDKGQPGL